MVGKAQFVFLHIVEVGQRVRKGCRATLWHREHQMDWDSKRLRAMDVCKTWWIRDDGMGYKWHACLWVRLNT